MTTLAKTVQKSQRFQNSGNSGLPPSGSKKTGCSSALSLVALTRDLLPDPCWQPPEGAGWGWSACEAPHSETGIMCCMSRSLENPTCRACLTWHFFGGLSQKQSVIYLTLGQGARITKKLLLLFFLSKKETRQ